MSKKIVLAGVAGLALAAASAARAQSVDYGSLQQLFGEPVTTSATGAPQRSTEAPVDMTIITADDIKRSGSTDLPTILSRVPGIDVLSWGATGADVGIRGYDRAISSRLLVLINGRQVYMDHYGYTAWSNLPVTLNEIRQIEVVRGPNSALFGFNAVGGVVNIITFNPKYDNTNTIEAHGGTQRDEGASAAATFHLGDRISARISAGAERQDEWKNTASYSFPYSAHSEGDVVVQLAPKTELRLEGSLAKSRQVDAGPNFNELSSIYTSSSFKSTLISDTSLGELQFQAYINDLKDSGAGIVLFKNQVEVVTIQDLFKVGARSTIRIAGEFRDNEDNTSLAGGHIGYSVWAPSAMWNFAATSNLSLTAAARVDALSLRRSGAIPAGTPGRNSDWNRSLQTFSANLGAVYKLTPQDTLRATYARGVQIPTLVELGALQFNLGPTLSLGGNPNLNPAIVTNYQLSYDRALPKLNSTVSAKVFFQQTDNIIGVFDPSSPDVAATGTTGAQSHYVNASNSEMWGFELAASGKLWSGFHWSADTTYTDVTDTAIGEYNLVRRYIAFAKTTPKYRGNVAAGWSDSRWAIDAYLHYVSKFNSYGSSGLTPVAGYATLAGRIGYLVLPGLTVSLSGQNLTTPRQVQTQAALLHAERRVLIGVSKTF